MDTIGVLQGDQHQVFGEIGQACCDTSGNILVLDRMNSTVSVFSPGGDFIEMIGGTGEAPWEFSWATSMAPMYNGWLLVSDYAGGKIVVFNGEMEYSESITGFTRTAPAMLQPLPDGTYIGRDTELWQSESGELHGENSVNRWAPDSPDPLATYLASPMFITQLVDGLDVKPASLVFTTSPGGTVYCAVSSDSLFQVFSYSPEGDPVMEITEPWERVAKTQEQMEAEGIVTAMRSDDAGENVPTRIEVEVNPFHNAVKNLCCDHLGRLWVRIGSEAAPTFMVYDGDGQYQFTAACPELEQYGGQIRFQMTHGGIVAWDTQPEDYPKVYLIEMPEL